jgi:hypothetical protein
VIRFLADENVSRLVIERLQADGFYLAEVTTNDINAEAVT